MLLNIGNDRKISEIPIVQIRPCRTQTRKSFDHEKMKELAASIKENGILQPITVRKISFVEYELVCGERRLRAAAMCGKAKIPCIVLKCSDTQAELYSLVENLQKSQLDFFEEAEGIYTLINMYGLSYSEAAEKLGKKTSAIENKLRLLHIKKHDRNIILKYNLTENHALALLRVSDQVERRMILSEIVEHNMNTEQANRYISSMLDSKNEIKRKNQRNKYIIKNIRIFENTISKAIDCMCKSGIAAECHFSENQDYVQYTITIPKHQPARKSEKELTA